MAYVEKDERLVEKEQRKEKAIELLQLLVRIAVSVITTLVMMRFYYGQE